MAMPFPDPEARWQPERTNMGFAPPGWSKPYHSGEKFASNLIASDRFLSRLFTLWVVSVIAILGQP
jgi:hypothetical protein